MRKIILTAFLSFFSITACFSQDVIIKRSGGAFKAQVIEVTPTEIKYKKLDYLEGPAYSVLKSQVEMVRYENGTKEMFDEVVAKDSVVKSSGVTDDLFMKGQRDATKYYKGYKDAASGTFVLSLLSPLGGLIPAIACSATPPKAKNLNFPNAELMKNSEYNSGFSLRAKKIKQGKVWKNWGIAFGVNVVLVLLLSSAQ